MNRGLSSSVRQGATTLAGGPRGTGELPKSLRCAAPRCGDAAPSSRGWAFHEGAGRTAEGLETPGSPSRLPPSFGSPTRSGNVKQEALDRVFSTEALP